MNLKRIFSSLLAAFLAIGIVSTGVSATETTVTTADELTSAISNASSGDTITLGANITASITVSTTLTINLNGYTLTASSGPAIYVTIDGNLTIEDSEGTGAVYNGGTGSANCTVFNNGTTTINGGTYSVVSNGWYTIVNHGTMTINDGTFTATHTTLNSSLIENGYASYSSTSTNNGASSTGDASGYSSEQNSASPALTINGGTFSTTYGQCVKNDDGGVLVINDGTFSDSSTNTYGLILNYNVATINGGTYTTANSAIMIQNNYSDYVDEYTDQGLLTITGGTYTASNGVFGVGKGESSGTTTISGGDFTSTTLSYTTYDDDMDDYFTITGGAYTLEDDEDGELVATLVDEGYVAIIIDEDGTTYVGTASEIAAIAAEAESSITVVAGSISFDSSDLNCEVTVYNTGDGTVTVDDEEVDEEGTTTDHSYTFTTEWSSDYSSVTFTFTCTICGETYTVTTTEIYTIENEDGSITYYASVDGPDLDGYYDEVTVEATTSDTSDTTDSVDTGDASHVYAWLWMMLAAGFVLIGKGVYTIKHNR